MEFGHQKLVPFPRGYSEDSPPADWDICYKGKSAMWRCPAFVKFRDGEIRRCSVCKRKNKWREHLKGNHKFDIPEQKDDQYMINITKNRIRISENRMQDNILRDKIKNLTAKLAGTLTFQLPKHPQ